LEHASNNGERKVLNGPVKAAEYLKIWGPILVVMFPLIGWGYTITGRVDSIKEDMGEPGSMNVIKREIEMVGEQIKEIKEDLKDGEKERTEMMKIMQQGQQKIDGMYDLMLKEQKGK